MTRMPIIANPLSPSPDPSHGRWRPIVVAAVLSTAYFLVFGRWGINLSDEGYLYYGVLRVNAGETPHADFQSYDPYRYYWAAAWTWILGDSLLSVRISVAMFAGIGLAFALAVARRLSSRWDVLLAIGLLHVLCFYPRWKLFDVAASMMAVWLALRLIEAPSARRALMVGVGVGLLAGLGRNHGLYAAAGIGLCLVPLFWSAGWRRTGALCASLAAGMALGYLPILIQMASVAGYFEAIYEQTIGRTLRTGSTNLALPLPWPWAVPMPGYPAIWAFIPLGASILFVLFFAIYGAGLLTLLLRRLGGRATGQSPPPSAVVLTAAVLVGLPYLNHVFSRADYSHITQSFHPAILAATALVALAWRRRSAWRWPALMLPAPIVIVAGAFMWNQPSARLLADPSHGYRQIDVNGGSIYATAESRKTILVVRKVTGELVEPGQSILFAPNLTMLYALVRRRAPIWEIYNLFPRPAAMQWQMIRDLRQRNTVLLVLNVNSRERSWPLSLERQLPMVMAFLKANFAPHADPDLPANLRLFRRRRSP